MVDCFQVSRMRVEVWCCGVEKRNVQTQQRTQLQGGQTRSVVVCGQWAQTHQTTREVRWSSVLTLSVYLKGGNTTVEGLFSKYMIYSIHNTSDCILI